MKSLSWFLRTVALFGIVGLLLSGAVSIGNFLSVSGVAQIDPCKPQGTGSICRITFDQLPDGSVPSPFGTVIKEQYKSKAGVIFPDGGAWVIKPRDGTKSGEFALINATSDGALEFNRSAMKIQFLDTMKVTRVSMHIGLVYASSKGVKATLTVKDSAGKESSMTDESVGDGPTKIDRFMEIKNPGFFIKEVTLQYADYAVEVIDDLEFETEVTPTCPPSADKTSPIVEITKPNDGDTFSASTMPQLWGTIYEESEELATVAVDIKQISTGARYTVNLTDVRSDKMVSGLFRFAAANLGLYEGVNEIKVSVEDSACPANKGEDSITVNFKKPSGDMNLYAIGVEITQAIQDVLQKQASSRRSGTPVSIAYTGIPLVANKKTVVRVYAAVEGTTEPINSVPAKLIIRRGSSTRELIASGITVDPADNVKTGGTLNLEQTLEKKRADIKKSWNFVLPDSATDDGQIDALEVVVNPTESSGPQECLGCNDAANRVIVVKVPVQRTASLTLRPYYVLGDGKQSGSDSQVFCSGFLNMYPVQDGCGTGQMDTNDLLVGIGLLPLVTRTMTDDKGNLVTDRGIWQDEMCKQMVMDKGAFTPPVAYVAIGPGGMGGAPSNGISPAACAATDFPGYFEEYRYGVAAQEVGHGDFIGLWHACGDTPPGGWPKYKNAKGDEYYQGSIGHFGLDTSLLSGDLAVKDPAKVSDFMGYTYCDVWTTNSWGKRDTSKITINARKAIRIGESSPLPDTANLLTKPIGGAITARGLSFELVALTPATSARVNEAVIKISGTATAGDLYIQVDERPVFRISVTAGQGIESIRDALDLNKQTGVDVQDKEFFSAYPWVSPYSYRLMFEQFRGAVKRSAINDHESSKKVITATIAEGEPKQYLLASGRIGPADRLQLDPFYRVSLPNTILIESGRGEGTHSFELQGQGGKVLLTHRFDPQLAHPDLPEVRPLYETIPYFAGTVRVILRRGSTPLATRVVSANTPKVTVLAPNGGESWGTSGTQVVQWTASDADQDKLFYLVQYSKDGGQTWQTLATDLTETKLVVDTALLPGSDKALVRVLATDGVNTGQDQSDATFKVAKKDPRIFITGLTENALVEPGAVVNLQANIIDPDGDPIDEKTVVWRSDKAGILGTGTRFELALDKLPAGANQISLNVPGTQGQSISQSLAILRVPLLTEVPRSSPLSLHAVTKVAKMCGANSTHEIEISWKVTGAQDPVQVTLDVVDPAGNKQNRQLGGLQGTAKFAVHSGRGGIASVRVTVKDAFGTTASAAASPDLPSVTLLQVKPTDLVFSGEVGRTNPPAQSLTIAGTGTLNWSASTDINWLIVNPARGTAPTTASVSVNINGLRAGIYQGRISIRDAANTGCPLEIPVILTLSEPAQTDPLKVSASATAKQVCNSTFSHELTVTWKVTGGKVPISVTIEITGPDGKKQTVDVKETEGTRMFSLAYPGGGSVSVRVTAKDANNSSSSAQSSVQLGKCS